MTHSSADSDRGTTRRGRRPVKQRDAERTRRRLLDAGEQLFAESGLEGASAEAIARRAGVSKTMLFYYFQSKEQLYIEVLRHLYEAVMDPARIAEIESMNPREAVMAIAGDYFDIHINRPTFTELTFREVLEHGAKHIEIIRYDMPFIGQMFRTLRRGVLSGDFRPMDPVKTGISLIGMTKILFVFRELWVRVLGEEIVSAEMMKVWREHVVSLLLYGISVQRPEADSARPFTKRSDSDGSTDPGGLEHSQGVN